MTAGNALIVAGSRGLGLGLVREHLARGWRVTATARGPAPGLEVVGGAAEGRLTVETLDVMAAGQAAALANRLTGQTFDLLFLNPGIMAARNLSPGEASDEDLHALFFTNAFAPIRAADALAKLAAPGATIAFMSSILGSIGTNDDGRNELYRASKAALNSLIRSFRARRARPDVTVLALHPGVVRTDMGGPTAPLDIETSVRGLVDTMAARRGGGGLVFVDYRNEIIPW